MVQVPTALESKLERLRRRFVAGRVLSVLSRWLPAPLLCAALVVLADRFRIDLGSPWPVLGAGAAAVLAWALLRAWMRRPSPLKMALLLDRRLGTREVLAAAVEAGPAASHPLLVEARQRASRALQRPDAAESVRLPGLRSWRAVGLSLLALLLVPLVPGLVAPPTPAADPAPQLVEAGEALAEEVKRIAEDLPELMDDETEQVFEQLERLAAELRSGEKTSLEEALLALDQAEQAVRELESKRGAAAQRALGSLLDELEQDPFAGDLARALADGDEAALREALERMARALPADQAEAMAQIEQLQELTERLQRLADQLRELGHEQAAEQLEELIEAIRNYDLDRARELLGTPRMVDTCRALGGALGRELFEALNLARYLIGSGHIPPLEAGESADGAGDGRAGPFPGTGSTNEQAEGYETGDPLLRNRISDETAERLGRYEALYESHIVEAESWVDVRAPGELGTQGGFSLQEGRALGTAGEAGPAPSVPPFAAPGSAERAAELERVPLGYRGLIRRYFSREPSSPAKEGETP